MNKIFSHKVTFQIISVILVILLTNAFIENYNLNKYVYKRLDSDLKGAMSELDNMNNAICGVYIQEDFKKDYNIDNKCIFELDKFNREMGTVDKMIYGDFKWFDLEYIKWNIEDIRKNRRLTKADERYLKSMHKYNKRLIQTYYKILNKNKIYEDTANKNYRKIKKVYEEFMSEANKIAMEEEYKKMIRYDVDTKEIKTKINISLEQANQLSIKVLEKLFHEKPLLTEVKDNSQEEYEFNNEWKDKKDKNLYSISINKENGSLTMYKRSQMITSGVSIEKLDEKIKKIKKIFVPQDYICYEKQKKCYKGEFEAMKYKFIRKTNDVYDESKIIEIEINAYGYLSELQISDFLEDKNINVKKPKFAKEEIIFKLKKGKIKNVLLVKDSNDQLQYRIFVDLNKELYTCTFDANTGEKIDFKKSDNMYFKRINDI